MCQTSGLRGDIQDSLDIFVWLLLSAAVQRFVGIYCLSDLTDIVCHNVAKW